MRMRRIVVGCLVINDRREGPNRSLHAGTRFLNYELFTQSQIYVSRAWISSLNLTASFSF